LNNLDWSLSFVDLTKILEKCGWEEIGISMLKEAMFQKDSLSKLPAHCTESCVSWPDFQEVLLLRSEL